MRLGMDSKKPATASIHMALTQYREDSRARLPLSRRRVPSSQSGDVMVFVMKREEVREVDAAGQR